MIEPVSSLGTIVLYSIAVVLAVAIAVACYAIVLLVQEKTALEKFTRTKLVIDDLVLEAEEMSRLQEIGKGEGKLEHVLERLDQMGLADSKGSLRGRVKAAVYRFNRSRLFSS